MHESNAMLTSTEIVPKLLNHLNIPYVSLASHNGGDLYLLNTILTYPHLLHPHKPYVCFFAPWVHPSHTKVTQLQVTSFLTAPIIGNFASVVRFINENVVSLVRLSRSIMHTRLRPDSHPAPVPLKSKTTRSRNPSITLHENRHN
jgi:hypothetical protein